MGFLILLFLTTHKPVFARIRTDIWYKTMWTEKCDLGKCDKGNLMQESVTHDMCLTEMCFRGGVFGELVR
jgi:hypothetical protein